MIYELREYRGYMHNIAALNSRFKDHSMELFKRHGFRLVGFWSTVIGDVPELTYLLAWESFEERQKSFSNLSADPQWISASTESEAIHGPMIAGIKTKLMNPTAYSPLK